MGWTVAEAVWVRGRGLHGGQACAAGVAPARAGAGLTLNGGALAELRVVDATRATVLASPTGPVAVVEHLLGALLGLGITDAALTVQGGEVPILDGSAAPWVAALRPAPTGAAVTPWRLAQPLEIRDGARWIRARPAPRLSLVVTAEHPPVPPWRVETDLGDFAWAIAPARTYVFAHDLPALRTAGLARGGALDNALVLDDHGTPWAGPLRLPDEPARHKALDLLGDLARLGRPLAARIEAERPGHALNHRFVDALRARGSA